MPSDRPTLDLDGNARVPLAIDALAAPLEGALPCGPDLEYDAAFQALEDAAAGKPERQYGDTLYPPEPPDWPTVRARARALAERTRDLRVVVWLLRSEARVGGFVPAVDALKLLQALLERHWPTVHPALDPGDGNGDDPTARLNAIFPLHHDAGLDDLRAASLTGRRGGIAVRALELAYGRAVPRPGEAVPVEERLRPGVRDALLAEPALAAAMQHGAATVRRIAALLDERLGGGESPELAPLAALMDAVATAGSAAQAELPAGAVDARTDAKVPAASAPPPAGEIRSRADAVLALERVCRWLEDNEPTHPAPILILRAQRLLAKKNFLDVIRDLVPEGIGQIEKLAGPSA